jgi:D-glycero-D-manno-heptose 1,7-bisphosphate phosphatase
MKKAAFFDRDGTLIHDVGYLSKLTDCRFIPGVIDLLLSLQQAGYMLVVVTNQSGIARGYFNESFVEETHNFLAARFLEHGVTVAAFYFCPHHPEKALRKDFLKACDCRKPLPGMFMQASRDLDIDLTASLMIGDSVRDLEAGRAAGCRVFLIDEVLAAGISDL